MHSWLVVAYSTEALIVSVFLAPHSGSRWTLANFAYHRIREAPTDLAPSSLQTGRPVALLLHSGNAGRRSNHFDATVVPRRTRHVMQLPPRPHTTVSSGSASMTE